ncbi:efflux RND transporter periplasmic adaptor subunit [Marinobacterium arenosum]|uniref:efflux RND transporter periplasmic adaptor subunit n=1 Tax=Marinobacterium arenosum TaxID=2862496 RepID=UPI001C978667|nr:efflux RND transporter periplasmic adaptor subunit [Marinobacterium arenosum]MBY4677936.1 efflux RND transporter periplasmic adaptor subunit [Marinobacterium arenosum]
MHSMPRPIRLLLLIPLLLGLAGCQQEQDAQLPLEPPIRPAKLITVADPAASLVRTFPAEVRATERTEMAFRLPGELIEMPVQEGQPVSKGDLLARLDPKDYQLALDQQRAQYRLAKAQFDRFDAMLKRKLVSPAQYDEKRAELDVARAALRKAELDLAYTELHAPYEGVVSQRLVENFQNVQAKQPVLVLQSGDQIDILFQVPESLAAQPTRPDARAYRSDVFFEARPEKPFKAGFRERTAEADPQTGSYTVSLTMTRPEELAIFPGMTASVQVDLAQVFELDARHVLLPVESLFVPDGQSLAEAKPQVWKVDPQTMRVSLHPVEVGRVTARGVEILTGVEPGDQIVAAGVHHLTEGMQVRPWQRERGL